MVPVALTFAVLNERHGTADVGYVLAAQTVPLVALLLVGGVVADRFWRRATTLPYRFPRAIWIRRSRTAPRLTRRPSCSCSLVTHDRSPRTETAVRSESSRSTYMSLK